MTFFISASNRDIGDYVGEMLGEWKRKWKLLCYIGVILGLHPEFSEAPYLGSEKALGFGGGT